MKFGNLINISDNFGIINEKVKVSQIYRFFCCQHLNLKGKTLLVVVNKLFVFSSKAKHDFFQFSQWPTVE